MPSSHRPLQQCKRRAHLRYQILTTLLILLGLRLPLLVVGNLRMQKGRREDAQVSGSAHERLCKDANISRGRQVIPNSGQHPPCTSAPPFPGQQSPSPPAHQKLPAAAQVRIRGRHKQAGGLLQIEVKVKNPSCNVRAKRAHTQADKQRRCPPAAPPAPGPAPSPACCCSALQASTSENKVSSFRCSCNSRIGPPVPRGEGM